jgi:hypothetical protein
MGKTIGLLLRDRRRRLHDQLQWWQGLGVFNDTHLVLLQGDLQWVLAAARGARWARACPSGGWKGVLGWRVFNSPSFLG